MDGDTVKRAVALVGGQSSMAKSIGVTQQAVQQWVANNRVPAARAMEVEKLCDGRITRYELRPDVFGPGHTDAA